MALAGQLTQLTHVGGAIEVARQVPLLARDEQALDEQVDELVEQAVLQGGVRVHELQGAQHVVDLRSDTVTQLVRVHAVGIPHASPKTLIPWKIEERTPC